MKSRTRRAPSSASSSASSKFKSVDPALLPHFTPPTLPTPPVPTPPPVAFSPSPSLTSMEFRLHSLKSSLLAEKRLRQSSPPQPLPSPLSGGVKAYMGTMKEKLEKKVEATRAKVLEMKGRMEAVAGEYVPPRKVEDLTAFQVASTHWLEEREVEEGREVGRRRGEEEKEELGFSPPSDPLKGEEALPCSLPPPPVSLLDGPSFDEAASAVAFSAAREEWLSSLSSSSPSPSIPSVPSPPMTVASPTPLSCYQCYHLFIGQGVQVMGGDDRRVVCGVECAGVWEREERLRRMKAQSLRDMEGRIRHLTEAIPVVPTSPISPAFLSTSPVPVLVPSAEKSDGHTSASRPLTAVIGRRFTDTSVQPTPVIELPPE